MIAWRIIVGCGWTNVSFLGGFGYPMTPPNMHQNLHACISGDALVGLRNDDLEIPNLGSLVCMAVSVGCEPL